MNVAPLLALAVLLAGGWRTAGQEFEITSATLGESTLQITFPGRADSYYLLDAAESLSLGWQPTNALLGSVGGLSFAPALGHERAVFFRVEQLPLTATNDIIGDGIPDGFKLLHGLPVFGPSEANLVPLGDTRTWLEIYNWTADQEALPVAQFGAPSYTVVAGSGAFSVPVQFTKPYTGWFTYQLSGTAVPSSAGVTGDYIRPSGSNYCNNAATANITITLTSQPDIEVNRTIVIAISAPPLTNQTYTITTNTSVTTVRILQSTLGLFVGTLAITNGAQVGAQSVKMAIRPGANGNLAWLDVTGNALLGNMFSIPVNAGTNGFQLGGAQYSTVVTNTPWGRSLGVNLSFGATQTNGNSLATPLTMSLSGLTASGLSYSGFGTLNLARSQ
jgi:hypothetical protein